MWSAYLLTLAVVADQVGFGRASILSYTDSSGCVDESGFKDCIRHVYDSSTDCIANCAREDDDCFSACDCLEAQNEINCAATSCWNEVYSCAYQEAVGQLLYTCPVDIDTSQIPFYPTPDDAPGGCACDVSQVATKQRLIRSHVDECDSNDKIDHFTTEAELADYLRGCACCTMSALISSIWDTCPNTDPYATTFGYWNRTLFSPYDWDACGPYVEKYDCADSLSLGTNTTDGIEHFYTPDNVPKNGTGILTTTGTGTISTPLSGSSFTWTLGSSTYHITAAASNTAAATTDASQTTGQGAQETGESAGSLQARPGVLMAVAAVGVYIGFVGV